MIGEMAEQIREEDEPARQADLPNADSTQEAARVKAALGINQALFLAIPQHSRVPEPQPAG
jgi:hypothetical protein